MKTVIVQIDHGDGKVTQRVVQIDDKGAAKCCELAEAVSVADTAKAKAVLDTAKAVTIKVDEKERAAK